VSGAKYVGTIEVSVNVNLPTPPSESAGTTTLVSNLRIVRAGESPPSDDYNEHSVAHLTITANDEETAFVDLFLGGCA
jgi:hypothetical protein